MSFKFQAGMGANMVVAIFTAFIISYWASKFIVDKKSHVRSDSERNELGGEGAGARIGLADGRESDAIFAQVEVGWVRCGSARHPR